MIKHKTAGAEIPSPCKNLPISRKLNSNANEQKLLPIIKIIKPVKITGFRPILSARLPTKNKLIHEPIKLADNKASNHIVDTLK